MNNNLDFVFLFKSILSKEGLIIEGIASTDGIDRHEEIIDLSGWRKVINRFLGKTPTLLFDHGQDPQIARKPMGKVLDAKVTSAGLWVRAKVTDKWAIEQIQEGNIRTFSWAGTAQKNDKGKFVVTDWYELSIVTVPANIDAQFAIAKAFNKLINKENMSENKKKELKEEKAPEEEKEEEAPVEKEEVEEKAEQEEKDVKKEEEKNDEQEEKEEEVVEEKEEEVVEEKEDEEPKEKSVVEYMTKSQGESLSKKLDNIEKSLEKILGRKAILVKDAGEVEEKKEKSAEEIAKEKEEKANQALNGFIKS